MAIAATPLYARLCAPDRRAWTEYAAFSPLMEVMSSKNIGPWDFDAEQQPRGQQRSRRQPRPPSTSIAVTPSCK